MEGKNRDYHHHSSLSTQTSLPHPLRTQRSSWEELPVLGIVTSHESQLFGLFSSRVFPRLVMIKWKLMQ